MEVTTLQYQARQLVAQGNWSKDALQDLIQQHNIPELKERSLHDWQKLVGLLDPSKATTVPLSGGAPPTDCLKHERHQNDFYPTPAGATEALLDKYPAIKGSILECCSGANDVTKVLFNRGLSVTTNDKDINHDADFHLDVAQPYHWSRLPQADWVITNPPYAEANSIVPLAYQHARVGAAMLLRLSFLEPTLKRGEWLAAHPPTHLIAIPRISFTGNGKTDTVTTVWLIWHKGHHSNITVVPKTQPKPINLKLPLVATGGDVEYANTDEIVLQLQLQYQGNGKPVSKLGQPDARRELIECQADGKRYIPEGKLNLFADPFDLDNVRVDHTNQIPPYTPNRLVAFDIETEGLDWERHKVLVIGIQQWGEDSIFFQDEAEATLLKKFIHYFQAHCIGKLVIAHNGYGFDYPFVNYRCLLLGIDSPFSECRHTTSFGHIQFAGKPLQVRRWEDARVSVKQKGAILLDSQLMVRLYDSVEKVLQEGCGLKTCPVELELRTTDRVELEPEEIHHHWANGKQSLVLEYLEDDLSDTLLLANYLVPIYWGLQTYFTRWDFSRIICSGNGSKWNHLIAYHYKHWPESESRYIYEGALRLAREGLYTNVYSIDVQSLYPAIMLRYGAYAREKDTEAYMLQLIQIMRGERLKNKRLGKKDATKAQLAQAQKILINSGYGCLASSVNYNDMLSATVVSAYGRELLRLLVSAVEATGGTAITFDTDGVFFTSNNPELTLEVLYKVLPDGIELDPDYKDYDWIFVPPTKKFTEADGEYLGLRSTYMGCQAGEVSYTGARYKTRGSAPWKLQHETALVQGYISGRMTQLNRVAADWEAALIKGHYDPAVLVEKRTIPGGKNPSKLRELGEVGDRVKVFQGIRDSQHVPVLWCGQLTEPVHLDYYLKKARDLYKQVTRAIEHSITTEVTGNVD